MVRPISSVLSLLVLGLGLVIAPRASADEAPSAPAAEDRDSFKLPLFVNNALAYAYGPDYRAPFVATASQPDGADIARSALDFAHVDSWRYGHNLAELTLRRSNATEPAAGGGSGATEFYSIFRSGIAINRVAAKPVIRLGPLRDIDIQAGADLQTKNTAFAPNERTLYLGPRLLFILGDGFFNLGLQVRKEWNHNGILGTTENYDVDFNVEPTWSLPFRISATRFVFDGFAEYNTPKGKDASGRPTRAELMARPEIKIDVGQWLGRAPGVIELGVAVEYWRNMFGKDGSITPGATQTTPVLTFTMHWSGRRAPDTDARSQLR